MAAAACRVIDPGLPATYDGDVVEPPAATPEAPETADAALDAAQPDAAAGEPLPEEAGIPGDPLREGCADGTREGFTSETDWPDIAGCSGAWSMGGLLGPQARDPLCMRQGGNDGQNPWGDGCGVADLCAAGWHVCRDAADVRHSSPSGCESAVQSAEPRFFLTLAGASPQGICAPDRNAANDLHGCGNFGQSESAACEPLNRRMSYAECEASMGVWSCGGPGEHLIEAALVSKTTSALGGVLCCRDR
ncbi:MAG TPA: hypothetical protein VN914_19750 [Polyangia bacterium]|nr:hypothetical protein [Polyangia bacterium]